MINQLLKTKKIQAILITKPENIRHQSGFTGSFAEIILTKTKKILITDSRYEIEANKHCNKEFKIIIIQDYQKDLSKIYQRLKIDSLGFESSNFTYSKFLAYKKLFKSIKLIPLKHEIDHLRLVKSEQEIKLIHLSQQLSQKILLEIQKSLKPNVTEIEIAQKIKLLSIKYGADKLSFDPIVAFGKNTSSPHSTPTNTKFKKNDIALIDMGVVYKGYCSDISRTFLPPNPSKEMLYVYSTVLKAQENCIKNIKPGITGKKADNLCRSIIKKAGYENNFTHASGHGVGLEIHEAPSLSNKSKHKDRNLLLAENMVVTVEPGIYIEGKFGVRIEDVIVIGAGKNNSIKNLTSFSKEI